MHLTCPLLSPFMRQIKRSEGRESGEGEERERERERHIVVIKRRAHAHEDHISDFFDPMGIWERWRKVRRRGMRGKKERGGEREKRWWREREKQKREQKSAKKLTYLRGTLALGSHPHRDWRWAGRRERRGRETEERKEREKEGEKVRERRKRSSEVKKVRERMIRRVPSSFLLRRTCIPSGSPLHTHTHNRSFNISIVPKIFLTSSRLIQFLSLSLSLTHSTKLWQWPCEETHTVPRFLLRNCTSPLSFFLCACVNERMCMNMKTVNWERENLRRGRPGCLLGSWTAASLHTALSQSQFCLIHQHTHTHTHTTPHTQHTTHACLRLATQSYTYAHTHTHRHMHTCTQAHTHTRTHTHLWPSWSSMRSFVAEPSADVVVWMICEVKNWERREKEIERMRERERGRKTEREWQTHTERKKESDWGVVSRPWKWSTQIYRQWFRMLS